MINDEDKAKDDFLGCNYKYFPPINSQQYKSSINNVAFITALLGLMLCACGARVMWNSAESLYTDMILPKEEYFHKDKSKYHWCMPEA
eukprot:15342063-Ditylum_brightwellii.AAC.1